MFKKALSLIFSVLLVSLTGCGLEETQKSDITLTVDENEGIGIADDRTTQNETEKQTSDELSEGLTVPDGLDTWLEETEMPEDIRKWIEGMRDICTHFDAQECSNRENSVENNFSTLFLYNVSEIRC
ncbi:MAG: hypothetical protein IJ002_03965 [Clostridia bacterium]|nr:hypothetical protein [Clostridia bacterium]